MTNETETPSRAAGFFDGYARDFDAIYGNDNTLFNRTVNSLFRKAMRLRFEKTLRDSAPITGRSMLDVGCGPGHYSVAFAKAGAGRVLGLDFAEGMIKIAQRNAEVAKVAGACEFGFGDFLTYPINEKFDYAVVMGFMEYIVEPAKVIRRVLDVTTRRAFFSFPKDGGFLAWQRKMRYKSRCDLFMYTEVQLKELFAPLTSKPVIIEPLSRDYFVTVRLD